MPRTDKSKRQEASEKGVGGKPRDPAEQLYFERSQSFKGVGGKPKDPAEHPKTSMGTPKKKSENSPDPGSELQTWKEFIIATENEAFGIDPDETLVNEVAPIFSTPFKTPQHAEGAAVASLVLPAGTSAPAQTCIIRIIDALEFAKTVRKEASRSVRGSSATGRHMRASPRQPQRRPSRDASPQPLKKRQRVEDTWARLISMVVTEPPGPAAVAPPSARRTAGPPGEWLSARVIAAAAPRQCEQPGERLVKLKRHDGSPTSGATAASPAAPAPVGVPTPVLSATPCAWPEPLAIVSGGEQGITECHQFEWRFGSGDISQEGQWKEFAGGGSYSASASMAPPFGGTGFRDGEVRGAASSWGGGGAGAPY